MFFVPSCRAISGKPPSIKIVSRPRDDLTVSYIRRVLKRKDSDFIGPPANTISAQKLANQGKNPAMVYIVENG